ncbi:MAG: hypothetical protein APF81_13900 [Desulfosporosinus sp. BRH_c37]|nr:MAG: hypothetical protein APF81_13900 [Desulfosporosinus sp. BRH_c37]
MMSNVLLPEETHKTRPVLMKTKLFIPQAHELLPRPRLTQELNKSLNYRLNLVVAPAGYGKTTAVAEWARQNNLPVTWFSIDEGDNDPVNFWSYLLMALEQIIPGIGEKAAVVLRSIGMPQVEKALSLLIDDILGLSQEFTLVLDDFHLIKNPVIHDSFVFLLQYMPDFMHIILISRELPFFSVARMMGKGMLKELLTPGLRFTQEEIAAFCRSRDLTLTWEEAIELEARTEGWAAGLHLAALSMKDSHDILGAIYGLKGNNQYLSGYLFDEVLNQWPDNERTFLLKTSILDKLYGPLCDAVTGQTGSEEVLGRLAKKNAFITVLGPEGYWYRYHHLFAEFLQSRWGRENATQRNSLHRLAGEWYERNGFLTDAVHHFIEGECFSQAVLLLQKLALGMLEKGETELLLNWLNVLPESWRSQNPLLCLSGAWALILSRRFEQVENWLNKAGELCGERRDPSLSEEEQQRILGEICLARARLYHYDLKLQGTLLKEACLLIQDKSIFLQVAMQPKMGIPGILKGFFNYTRDLREIEPFFRQLKGAMELIGLQSTGLYNVVCGELAYEWNDLEEAARQVIKGIHYSEKVGEEEVQVIGLLTLGRVFYAGGFIKESLNALDEAGRRIRAMDALYWLPVMEASRVRLWLAKGEMESVRQWMATNRMSIYDRLSPEREFEYITLAKVLLAQGNWEKVFPLLTKLLTFTENENRPASVIEVLNLLALAHQERGEYQQALLSLHKSLALAEKDGYLRTYIDEGVPILRLLKKLGRWMNQRPLDSNVSVSTGYIKKLIKILQKDTVPKMQVLSSKNENYGRASRAVEPLTEKELEVLRLLALDMKNSGISGLLNISVNTVKVHTRNIYNKLMVGNRFHAVERARELKIIE